MVGAASLEDVRIDLIGGHGQFREQLGGKARLEELAARQSGDDERNPPVVRFRHRQRVDRLEAALADVGVPLETVDEDLVHRRGGGEDVVDA